MTCSAAGRVGPWGHGCWGSCPVGGCGCVPKGSGGLGPVTGFCPLCLPCQLCRPGAHSTRGAHLLIRSLGGEGLKEGQGVPQATQPLPAGPSPDPVFPLPPTPPPGPSMVFQESPGCVPRSQRAYLTAGLLCHRPLGCPHLGVPTGHLQDISLPPLAHGGLRRLHGVTAPSARKVAGPTGISVDVGFLIPGTDRPPCTCSPHCSDARRRLRVGVQATRDRPPPLSPARSLAPGGTASLVCGRRLFSR